MNTKTIVVIVCVAAIACVIGIGIGRGRQSLAVLSGASNNRPVSHSAKTPPDESCAKVVDAANAMLESFQNLQSAVHVGLNYQNYSERLVEPGMKMDALLRSCEKSGPDLIQLVGNIHNREIFAMGEFQSARHGWEVQIQTGADLNKNIQDQWEQAAYHVQQIEDCVKELRDYCEGRPPKSAKKSN
jgi:hypothetical protein